MAKTYDLGSVMPVFKGEWVKGTAYERNNFVMHNSITWVCVIPLNETTTLEPSDANSTTWKVLVKSESKVSSVNGVAGEVKLPIALSSLTDSYVETLVDDDNNKYIFASTLYVGDKISTEIKNLLATFSLDLGKISDK